MSPEVSTQDPSQSAPATQFYQWRGYCCAYEIQAASQETAQDITPLLLIQPIGVGLSRRFWDRFCQAWFQSGQRNPIYNPDLLGCGESDMPHVAYSPEDWAAQIQYFLETVIQRPAIVVVQGASLPIALSLAQRQTEPGLIRGLVLAGPPAWELITQDTPTWQHKLLWNLFDSPLGNGFYRYARRRAFLQSFSTRQLFAKPEAVDGEWLDTLKQGSENLDSRHAVFSFLAGFWRQNYEAAIVHLHPPTLVVMGKDATSISRTGNSETPEQRIAEYLRRLPQGQGMQLSGRNVLPYEVPAEFVRAIAPFIQQL
jgi:pimeloyl-ACP methyl ester carboxylesterase